jgi:hypothetical protein
MKDQLKFLIEENARLVKRVGFLMEQNTKYRNRIHEAVDECQRRHAPDMRELAVFRELAVMAQQEIDKATSENMVYIPFSEVGRAMVANLLGRIKDLEDEVAELQGALRFRKLVMERPRRDDDYGQGAMKEDDDEETAEVPTPPSGA